MLSAVQLADKNPQRTYESILSVTASSVQANIDDKGKNFSKMTKGSNESGDWNHPNGL